MCPALAGRRAPATATTLERRPCIGGALVQGPVHPLPRQGARRGARRGARERGGEPIRMPERDRGQGACCGSRAAAVRQLCGPSCADPAAGASNDERPLPLRSHDVPFPGGLSSGMYAARRAPRDAPLASRSSTITLLTTPLTRLIRWWTSASDARGRACAGITHSHLDSLDCAPVDAV